DPPGSRLVMQLELITIASLAPDHYMLWIADQPAQPDVCDASASTHFSAETKFFFVDGTFPQPGGTRE
ncbi:MAG: hypothetical protein AAF686_07730, partial [Pseudomonadota bacterium]